MLNTHAQYIMRFLHRSLVPIGQLLKREIWPALVSLSPFSSIASHKDGIAHEIGSVCGSDGCVSRIWLRTAAPMSKLLLSRQLSRDKYTSNYLQYINDSRNLSAVVEIWRPTGTIDRVTADRHPIYCLPRRIFSVRLCSSWCIYGRSNWKQRR